MIFETKYRMQALLAWEKSNEENKQHLSETVHKQHELSTNPIVLLFAPLIALFTQNQS